MDLPDLKTTKKQESITCLASSTSISRFVKINSNKSVKDLKKTLIYQATTLQKKIIFIINLSVNTEDFYINIY